MCKSGVRVGYACAMLYAWDPASILHSHEAIGLSLIQHARGLD